MRPFSIGQVLYLMNQLIFSVGYTVNFQHVLNAKNALPVFFCFPGNFQKC